MKDYLVTVRTFSQLPEAGLVQSFLESEGIPTCLKDQYVSAIYGGSFLAGGIKLQVRADDYELAKQKLIQGGYASEEDFEEES